MVLLTSEKQLIVSSILQTSLKVKETHIINQGGLDTFIFLISKTAIEEVVTNEKEEQPSKKQKIEESINE